MTLGCGIVGLPNVGKSTLFNALTATAAAQASNYPFCTIEPNRGVVAVPDPRLDQLAQLARSAKIVPTSLEFTDIAGLVRGASKGEGLGNQFLGHIRAVDAILHVVRCFSGEITHVEGSVDPVRDAETVETELMLADLGSLEKRYEPWVKRAKSGDKEVQELLHVVTPLYQGLQEGVPARTFANQFKGPELIHYRQLQLLTSKPVLYVCNVGEAEAATGNAEAQKMRDYATRQEAGYVVISAAIESEIALLKDEAERQEFLSSLGLHETGLARLIFAAYQLLGLITFFTAGPKESRAWTIPKGATAFDAAGVIHSDFQRGFICAETISLADYLAFKGEHGAKESGKARLEGKDYRVCDGDVFHFRFNV